MGALISGTALGAAMLVAAAGCSPEARRVRDGGPGADPGNKKLVEWRGPDPRAADTTLWPGISPAPVERFARGEVPPPSYPYPARTSPKGRRTPVTPDVPPTGPQQRTFDSSQAPDPRRRSDSTPPPR